jgi:DNA-binding protein H-NS
MATMKRTTYLGLKKQIAQLEAQAESLRKSEVADVVAKIKEAVAHYGLTAADLGFGRKAATASAAPAKKRGSKAGGKAKKAGVIKFRDDAGHTWTGHGRRPQWFVDAVAAGKKPEDLAAK